MGLTMVVFNWIYVWKEGCEMGLPTVVFFIFIFSIVSGQN